MNKQNQNTMGDDRSIKQINDKPAETEINMCFWCENHCHAECANYIYGDSYIADPKVDEYTGDTERECRCNCCYPQKVRTKNV